MTEIPEHLRKRAEEARAKAARRRVPAPPQASRRGPRRGAAMRAARREAGERTRPSKIPAHLLERSKAAKAKAEGGEAAASTEVATAGAGAVATATATAAPPRRHRPRRAHPAPPHGGEVRVHPGRQGHPAGQGPRVAAPARGRVRRRAGLHRVPARVLGVRERAAARAGQREPDAEPVEGALVLPRPAGAAQVVPPDGGRRDAAGHGPGGPDPGAVHRPQPEQQAREPQVRHRP